MMQKEARPIVIVKKTVKGHGKHHGGAWKVAYADFVTAMMAFFMVMWIIGMDESVKNSIQGYFRNPVGFERGASTMVRPLNSGGAAPTNALPAPILARQIEEQRFRELGEKIKLKLQGPDGLGELAAQIEIIITEEGLRIELIEGGNGELFFAFASAELKPAADRALAIIAAELANSSAPIVLEGHTDSVRFRGGNDYTNWELSAARANAARRSMERHGLQSGRVSEVRGYADRHLRVPENPLDNSNRRISVLLPFSTGPGVLKEQA